MQKQNELFESWVPSPVETPVVGVPPAYCDRTPAVGKLTSVFISLFCKVLLSEVPSLHAVLSFRSLSNVLCNTLLFYNKLFAGTEKNQEMQAWILDEMNTRCHATRLHVPCSRTRGNLHIVLLSYLKVFGSSGICIVWTDFFWVTWFIW